MVERIQDINLPNTNVIKIIRDSLPNDVNIDKEACIAISRATSVFIMCLSSNAADFAQHQNHKTFSADNVIQAIDEMRFGEFIGPMKSTLGKFRQKLQDKKQQKQLEDKQTKTKQNESSTSHSGITPNTSLAVSDVIEIDDSD